MKHEMLRGQLITNFVRVKAYLDGKHISYLSNITPDQSIAISGESFKTSLLEYIYIPNIIKHSTLLKPSFS